MSSLRRAIRSDLFVTTFLVALAGLVLVVAMTGCQSHVATTPAATKVERQSDERRGVTRLTVTVEPMGEPSPKATVAP